MKCCNFSASLGSQNRTMRREVQECMIRCYIHTKHFTQALQDMQLLVGTCAYKVMCMNSLSTPSHKIKIVNLMLCNKILHVVYHKFIYLRILALSSESILVATFYAKKYLCININTFSKSYSVRIRCWYSVDKGVQQISRFLCHSNFKNAFKSVLFK